MEKTGCKVICGAQTTLAVKELMMMIMLISPCTVGTVIVVVVNVAVAAAPVAVAVSCQ